MTIEESGSICVTKNPSLLGGTPSHTAAAEGYHDEVMSSDSEPDGWTSDDTDTSSEKERPHGQFASRREFLSFGYLFGRACLTLQQYNIMSEERTHSARRRSSRRGGAYNSCERKC